jgi:hypothetical protein
MSDKKKYTVHEGFMYAYVAVTGTKFSIEFKFEDDAGTAFKYKDGDGKNVTFRELKFVYGGMVYYITGFTGTDGETWESFETKSTNEITGMELFFVIIFVSHR